jgi:hypothetical protein
MWEAFPLVVTIDHTELGCLLVQMKMKEEEVNL